MKIKLFIVAFMSLLFINTIFSQDVSTIKKAFERIDKNLQNKPLISLTIADSLLQNVGKTSDKAKLLKKIATAHYYLGNYDKSISFYQKAFNEFIKIDDNDGISSCYNNIGLIYEKKGNRDKAFDYLVKSLEIEQKRGNDKGIAMSYCNIGNFFYNGNELDKAEEYYLKGYKIGDEDEDKEELARISTNLGIIKDDKKEYYKAIEYYKKSLLYDKMANSQIDIATDYDNIGFSYKNLKEYKKALNYFNKSLKISQKVAEKYGIANSLNNVASVYLILNQPQKARGYLKKAMKIADEMKFVDLIELTEQNLIKMYKELGDYKSAQKISEKLLDFRKEVYDKNKTKEIAELTVKFDTKQKENEIQLQKKTISILQMQSEIQNLKIIKQRITFTLIILIFVFVTGFVSYRFYEKNKLNKILEKEIEKRKKIEAELRNTQDELKKELNKKISEFLKIDETLKNKLIDLKETKNKNEELNKLKSKLLHEVYHRVYNNLQIIISILKLHRVYSKDKQQMDDLYERIKLLSSVESLGYESDNPGKIPMKVISQLGIRNFYYKNAAFLKNVKIKDNVGDVEIDMKFFMPLAFIIYETLGLFLNCLSAGKNVISIYYTDAKSYLTIKLETENDTKNCEMDKSLNMELIDIFINQMHGKSEITRTEKEIKFKFLF